MTSIEECRAVAALERRIWEYPDSDEVVPAPLLIASVRCGGILLGAFAESGEMAGFVYSMPGIRNGRLMQWSHMLGVLPWARRGGVGARLKLAQREAALRMGIELIEWTFDPLQAPNAYLNLSKLGAIVEEYEENVYGDSPSPLHAGSPTDRFVAAWHLTRAHVERRIAAWGRPVVRDRSVSGAFLVNPAQEEDDLRPGRAALEAEARRVLVEIPTGYAAIQDRDPELALAWRLHTRDVFRAFFARGYRAVDFFLSRGAVRGHYLLVRDEPTATMGEGEIHDAASET